MALDAISPGIRIGALATSYRLVIRLKKAGIDTTCIKATANNCNAITHEGFTTR